jgi:hypothetical protein
MPLKALAALGRHELPSGVGAAVFSQAAAAPEHVVRPELVDDVETTPLTTPSMKGVGPGAQRKTRPFSDRWSV